MEKFPRITKKQKIQKKFELEILEKFDGKISTKKQKNILYKKK